MSRIILTPALEAEIDALILQFEQLARKRNERRAAEQERELKRREALANGDFFSFRRFSK